MIISFNSCDWPELEKASIQSFLAILPRSPWLASAGWTNCAGVPVEENVAAILFAICPLLPIPVTTILPLVLNIVLTTL